MGGWGSFPFTLDGSRFCGTGVTFKTLANGFALCKKRGVNLGVT